MVRTLRNATILSLLALTPSLAGAQDVERPRPLAEGPGTMLQERIGALPPAAAVDAGPLARPALIATGTGAGIVAGAALGAGLGYLIWEVRPRSPWEENWFGPPEAWAGGLPGATAGAFVGARLGSGGRGHPGWTALAAAAGVAGGIGLGVLAGDAAGSTAVGLIVGIPIMVGLPTLAEVATSRR